MQEILRRLRVEAPIEDPEETLRIIIKIRVFGVFQVKLRDEASRMR